MDLKLTLDYEAFRTDVRTVLATHRDRFPGGQGMERPRADASAWRTLQIEHGYADPADVLVG